MEGQKVMLFDIASDPEERRNVALDNPDVVQRMQARISFLADTANGYVPPQNDTKVPGSDPSFHNGTWAPFQNFSAIEVEL
jgi:hypothetical protein